MAHFLIFYETAPDYLSRRPDFRPAHLAHAGAAVARGDLLLGGAFDPQEGAALLFVAAGPETAEAFARADPYVVNGLVTNWRVLRWRTVVGTGAAEALPPP